MSISVSPRTALATEVSFSNDAMHVKLSDGRELSVPLEWFPKLRAANAEQLRNWRLIGGGSGIHWEEIDEDISVAGILHS